MLALALVLACAGLLPDVGQSLAALSAPRAEEREAAQRWLAGHLASEDHDALVAFLAQAEFEPRARLADLLGADARHFELARRLALANDVAARACGVLAVRAHVERWLGAPDAPPRSGVDPGRFLRDVPTSFRLELGGRSLEAAVDLISRRSGRAGAALAGGEPLPLVIDTALAADAERTFPSRAELLGRWDEVVAGLAARFDAGVSVYGAGAERAFAVLARRAGASPNSATQWLVLRSRVAFESGDAAERERAARALVASDFTPVVQLVARRYRATRDPALLSALALAAARGRVAPELVELAAARALRERAERALAAGGAHGRFVAAECARALAGARDATDGARPLAVLGEELAAAPPEVLAWRLTVARLAELELAPLTELARTLVASAAADDARALAAAAAFEYLAALGLAGGLAPAEPTAWLEAARQRGRGGLLVGAWARSGLAFPAAWTARALGPELAFARFDAEWDAASPALAPLAASPGLGAGPGAGPGAGIGAALVRSFLDALAVDLPALAACGARCEEWRQSGRRAAVAALLDAARVATQDPALLDALARLDARLGRVQGERAESLGELWLAAPDPDWVALGALAATPVGDRVRGRLLAELASLPADESPAGELGRGIEAAVAALKSTGDVQPANEFVAALEDALERTSLGRFSDALRARVWPVPAARRPIDLAAKDLPDGL